MYHVGGNVYEMIKDNKNGWNLEVFRNRYSEVLERYDYVVGDWGYNQLRLRGFFKENNPRSNKESTIAGFEDYINEYCNFGCAYFILEKVGQTDRPDDLIDPLAEETESSTTESADRVEEEGAKGGYPDSTEQPVRGDRYNRGGVEARPGRPSRLAKGVHDRSVESRGNGDRSVQERDGGHVANDRTGRNDRKGSSDRNASAAISSNRISERPERIDRSDRRHNQRRSGADATLQERRNDGNRRPRKPGSLSGEASSQAQGQRDKSSQHPQQRPKTPPFNNPSAD
ncbi:MAG: DUF1027 domain-containing protein [Gorillibacterium sp.]|nr:DUF1027 domain-containing protein [Gorillibacterium sp.]